MAIELNETNFKDEILDSPIPALVDFWATWCMPCQIVIPIIEELSQEYAGRLKVGKVDVDKDASLAAKYSILSIPAVLFFKNGQVVDSVIGAVPKGFIIDRINKII